MHNTRLQPRLSVSEPDVFKTNFGSRFGRHHFDLRSLTLRLAPGRPHVRQLLYYSTLAHPGASPRREKVLSVNTAPSLHRWRQDEASLLLWPPGSPPRHRREVCQMLRLESYCRPRRFIREPDPNEIAEIPVLAVRNITRKTGAGGISPAVMCRDRDRRTEGDPILYLDARTQR